MSTFRFWKFKRVSVKKKTPVVHCGSCIQDQIKVIMKFERQTSRATQCEKKKNSKKKKQNKKKTIQIKQILRTKHMKR